MRIKTGLTVAIAGALTFALGGCGLTGQIRTEDQSQEYAERVSRVEIELDSGDVVFSPATGEVVSVSRRLRWRTDKPVVTETFEGATMRVSVKCPRFGTCDVDYGVKVPAAASVFVRTDSGDITLTGMTGGADVRADSGNVRLDGAAGTVRAETDSGNIDGSGLLSGDLVAKADSGNIALTFVAVPATVDARADSGNVTLTVPQADGGYRVRADTDSGRRTVTVTESADATRTIVATADSGNVTVRH